MRTAMSFIPVSFPRQPRRGVRHLRCQVRRDRRGRSFVSCKDRTNAQWRKQTTSPYVSPCQQQDKKDRPLLSPLVPFCPDSGRSARNSPESSSQSDTTESPWRSTTIDSPVAFGGAKPYANTMPDNARTVQRSTTHSGPSTARNRNGHAVRSDVQWSPKSRQRPRHRDGRATPK